jgi:hypothetical protein
MKLLIAVKSCLRDRDRGAHRLIRDTWGKDVIGADLKFFMGNGAGTMLANDIDEFHVEAPDDYAGLPQKTQEIARRAQDYDFVFLCDTGSFVIPHHLQAFDFKDSDYIGYWGLKPEPIRFNEGNRARGCRPVIIPKCYPWASGGGYILSKKAAEIVASSKPVVWAEDCSVGQVLAAQGIFLDDRAKEGFKGYVVEWIHDEKNDAPDAMDRRRMWMTAQYEMAKRCCETGGCNSPLWDRRPQSRIPEDEVEEEIIKRRTERRRSGI